MSKHYPPLILQPISAGFPNPSEEASSLPLDLNEMIIKHPAATFFMRVEGTSMEGANIFSGDIVVIDKSLEVHSGDIVVAYIDGEFTLKRFRKDGGKGYLAPENPKYKSIEVNKDSDFQIWGVVTYTVHKERDF
jgi:DNA polymerase V